jgi:hypothetical protein
MLAKPTSSKKWDEVVHGGRCLVLGEFDPFQAFRVVVIG